MITYFSEQSERFLEFKKFITDQFKLENIVELKGCKSCKSTGL